MHLPITQKILLDWAGERVFQHGKSLFKEHRVIDATYEYPLASGRLEHGHRGLLCQFKTLKDGSVENLCPCRDNIERGIICSHVVAVGLELLRKYNDPRRAAMLEEEQRRQERRARFRPEDYIQRTRISAPGAIAAHLHIRLADQWADTFAKERKVHLLFFIGTETEQIPAARASKTTPYSFPLLEEGWLNLIEDFCASPIRSEFKLNPADFVKLTEQMIGHTLQTEFGPVPITDEETALSMHIDLSESSGALLLSLHPDEHDGSVWYFVGIEQVWMFDGRRLRPVKQRLPVPLHEIFYQPIVINRDYIPRFLSQDLPLLQTQLPVVTDISEDYFTFDPAIPQFLLRVKGSPASLAASLHVKYKSITAICCVPHSSGVLAFPDPDDILRFRVRNIQGEADGLTILSKVGFSGTRGDHLTSIIGTREVLNFLGSGWAALKRAGWHVEFEGRIRQFLEGLGFVMPVVHVQQRQEQNWFEVGFSFKDSKGESLSENDIQRALLKGDSYIEKDGKTLLVDLDAIRKARDIFSDCNSEDGSQPGSFRLAGLYSAYVESSLTSLTGMEIDATPEWLKTARSLNRNDEVHPVKLSDSLSKTLRPYQKDGVYWLSFLARNGLSGILADDMGLGKTIQALAWIHSYLKSSKEKQNPVLIVCPTSLVENWAEEAARFVPDLKVLLLSGADRHRHWESIADYDLVATSYALIRRDIEHYAHQPFSIAVLDEAQHIKNHNTQNSQAAKRINATHRLVLTGTPLENSVTDLWSIMDFLMPGYMGGPSAFKEHYEQPISRMGPEGRDAQLKLRRKLQPFLLRRLKKDVAKELPPKIEQVMSCTLSKDQQLVYNQLLENSKKKIYEMVDDQGFNQARMEILKLLLRLRQTCCHLDLLKLENIESTHPSAKMDLFFELLDESIDGGHRMLVFSQFTSMLAIIRKELEERSRPYCYLDGATKNRLAMVKKFNSDSSIPVFLISLKAGGTGLNLTGADTVIHFDPWWNPAVEDQATDRAYRIGQKRQVYCIKMITRGTVEEKVLTLQKRKKEIIDATLVQDEKVMEKLTWADIKELLEP
ncbi:MAG: DEAD/DEAH box helicase [Spartobacteria bacterium]|nr:DEAD/DEAH box helicase [Spartobacteria bacterium]